MQSATGDPESYSCLHLLFLHYDEGRAHLYASTMSAAYFLQNPGILTDTALFLEMLMSLMAGGALDVRKYM